MRIAVAVRALCALYFLIVVTLGANVAQAAPYAAMVVDARTGEVLHARNADARLHPASLTKMMTLYIVFDAVERGVISLDKQITISRHAASEPPSKLGLRAGQKIALRYLIRAAAVKSANDAATALGEAIAGSEAEFAKMMNHTARAIGMKNSTFKNAHGLTQSGHLSTARDMTLLGRRLFYDFPQYYNLFSRKSTHAGIRNVPNTNRRFLSAYKGADGIKTGFTNAAGFNLVASAERGNKRVIATVFGGRTTAWRNARVAELLDMGFQRSKNRVAVRKPPKVDLGVQAKRIRVANSGAVKSSPRPKLRTAPTTTTTTLMAEAQLKAIEAAVKAANREAQATGVVKTSSSGKLTSIAAAAQAEQPLRVVSRVSTAGNQYWGVQVGAFSSRHQAEKALLQTALRELQSLDGSERRIDYATVNGYKKYRARFVGLNQAEANLACARLRARNQPCLPIAPGS
ncbi:D-alanyl-D-alanine carboxypeptidase family protein [Neptunicoccus sediminis]|uniref:D-alanyl-D-alanine carboxypeptidase family protein n=1 Tax=Neptunicoccus sediminis TaxID=1892596 RepID=UPI00084607F8|nr:D-alanyl-D-alanine carboxypeptidase family protein [Neptunicoccus sediminis]